MYSELTAGGESATVIVLAESRAGQARPGQGVGERPSGEKEGLQGGLIGVPLARGSWGWANQK